jgi:hypothetical protein
MKRDLYLASQIAIWLEAKGCTVQMVERRNAAMGIEYHVMYTLASDTKPQPAVLVSNGKIVFPTGTPIDILFAFLGEAGDEDVG